MKRFTTSALRAGIELVLPSDCRFDSVPGNSDDAPWRGDTEGYRAWFAAALDPAGDEFVWGDAGTGRRAIPRQPRAQKV